MKNATMLFKAGGPHKFDGKNYDYITVDADEEGALDKAKADGWALTLESADGANEAVKKFPPVNPNEERAFPDSPTDFRTVAEVDAEIKAANAASETTKPKGGKVSSSVTSMSTSVTEVSTSTAEISSSVSAPWAQ